MTASENRMKMRTEINGRMVATHLPAEKHGTRTGYNYWHCRCEACTDEIRRVKYYGSAGAVAREEHRSVVGRLLESGADLDVVFVEYEHMRSFGMGHERACARIGVRPASMDVRLARVAVAS